MPALKVEYAKSGRSRCSLKECAKPIEKGEVRIGTGTMMPGADELSYKWRHLCCFTKRQLASLHSVDSVDGFDDLAEEDQALIHRLVKGDLIGNAAMLGRVAPSQAAAAAAGPKRPAKKTGGKRAAEAETPAAPTPVEDPDATDDDFGDVIASATAAAPKRTSCDHGATCYRKNPEHFKTHAHPGDADYVGAGGAVSVPVAPVAAPPDVSPAKKPKAEKQQTTLVDMWKGTGAVPAAAVPQPLPKIEEKAAVTFDAAGRKVCPFGKMCFRTAKDHFAEYVH